MTESHHPEQLLKRFERSEQAAIEAVLRRIGRAQARIAETAGKIPASLARELDSIRARLDEARRSAEARVEEFRAKLIEGPLTEEELRARLVMLEMEYASRVKLAEQGFDLLAERFENHVATGRHWISDVCDEVREAVRLDVKPVRARLGEALVERSRALAARERELDELRRLREGGALSEARVSELEERASRAERALAEARAESEQESRAAARLEARALESEREARRLKDENGELNRRLETAQSDADALLSQLRERVEDLRGGADAGEDPEPALKRLEETDEAIGGIIREAYNYREAATRFSARVRALEEQLEAVKQARFGEGSKQRLIEEKDAAIGRMLQEIHGQREAAKRFAARIQTLEIELAAAKADLKEMRGERRGLIERFNAAASDRDMAKKRAEKAEREAAEASEAAASAAAAAAQAAAKDGSRARESELKIAELTRSLEEARAAAKTDSPAEKTLDIDAEKADLAQRIEGKNREIAGLKSALDAAQKAWVSMRRQLTDAEAKAPRPAPDAPEVEALREEARKARSEAEETKRQLETERASAKMMQKRLFEADVARDRALSETRAQWSQEQERYEEQLSEKTREISMLRTQAQTADLSWQQILARQDADRMQEIFRLRAEIQKLKWKIEEQGK